MLMEQVQFKLIWVCFMLVVGAAALSFSEESFSEVSFNEESSGNESEKVDLYFLVQYQIPENWPDKSNAEQRSIEAEHIRFLEYLHKHSVLVMAGPILENGHRLIVLRYESLTAAIKLVQADPAIKSGHFGAKVNTWDVTVSSLWPTFKRLPKYDANKPFTVERLVPNAPITLKKH
ncbi:MAG: hypothetical protein ACI9FB_001131 [Candidatus Azotimanducaceae bacterium]|jgi:uncharacterized protein YciI